MDNKQEAAMPNPAKSKYKMPPSNDINNCEFCKMHTCTYIRSMNIWLCKPTHKPLTVVWHLLEKSLPATIHICYCRVWSWSDHGSHKKIRFSFALVLDHVFNPLKVALKFILQRHLLENSIHICIPNMTVQINSLQNIMLALSQQITVMTSVWAFPRVGLWEVMCIIIVYQCYNSVYLSHFSTFGLGY